MLNGGRLTREEDALRTRTSGRVDGTGCCVVALPFDSDDRALNMIGDEVDAVDGDWLCERWSDGWRCNRNGGGGGLFAKIVLTVGRLDLSPAIVIPLGRVVGT